MTVLAIKGQANAAVVLKGLLQQHGMPALTSEGIDTLSARFETGLVIGHGVVSYNGRPLITELQAILADAETRTRLFEPVESDIKQPGNLTEQMRQEVSAGRQTRRLPEGWQDSRVKYGANTITGQLMAEREKAWR